MEGTVRLGSINVLEPDALVANLLDTIVLYVMGNDGAATVDANGGTAGIRCRLDRCNC